MLEKIIAKYKVFNILIPLGFFGYIFTVFYLCFFNASEVDLELATHFLGIPIDKVLHFLMFFPFPVVFYLLMKYTPFLSKVKNRLLIGIVLGILISLTTELVQLCLVEGRAGELLDFVADVLGILTSTILLKIYCIVSK